MPEPLRELRPHAIWTGVELAWKLVEAAAIASLLALLQYFRAHLDLLTIVLVFVGSFAAMILGAKRSKNPVQDMHLDPTATRPRARIKGCRLFEHKGYYPIDIETQTNNPSLNSKIYVSAMHYLLETVHDPLAAMDLVYLREDNRRYLGDVLPPDQTDTYDRLVEKYGLESFLTTFSTNGKLPFNNAIRIVDDLGDTLKGIKCELILHDVRNPLRSIIAAKNTDEVSHRRLGGPSTRFVVQYLKHQGKHLIALESGSHVAYRKWFSKTKRVKATTTPLFDEEFGLVGLLCVNIDIDSIKQMNANDLRNLVERYTQTFGETPDFEKEDAPQV
jgi:hypothetical protein